MDKQSSHSRIAWKVPLTIVASFFFAIMLAGGHHFFYQSLNGTVVRNALFDQRYNVGIGTAFAFLVRALLVLSIGSTYWQVFWRTLFSETLTVSKIDTLFSLLSNPLVFARIRSLYRHPLLVTIAALSWTVPIAIIVPPATLSVTSQSITFHEPRTLHVPFFNTSSMAKVSHSKGYKWSKAALAGSGQPTCENDGNFLLYNGPNEPLSRVTMATAYQGALPRIHVPAFNASYTLSFNAPAARCRSAPDSIISELRVIMNWGDAMGRPSKYDVYEYVSWVPTTLDLVPLYVQLRGGFGGQIQFNGTSGVSNNKNDGFSSYLGQHQNMPPSLFIAYAYTNISGMDYSIWRALNCSFYKANYTVDFGFPDGQQSINITSVNLLEDPLILSIPIWSNCTQGNESGTMLTGEQVGYQAMVETLGRALVGTIAFSQGYGYTTTNLLVDQTSVLKTNLAFSNELVRLYGVEESVGKQYDSDPVDIMAGVNISSDPTTGVSLAAAIEQLFHNMTLSLFADKSMLTPSHSATNMTISKMQNVYLYSWRQLVLAYGVAILVTMLTVIVGCFILVANGAAYSSDFSTFLRLVRGQHIDDVVSAYDHREGADPLPKALAKARIQITTAKGTKRASEASSYKGNADEQTERTEMLSGASSFISRTS